MGGAELQMSRIRSGVIKYKVYITTTSWLIKCIFLKVQISPKLDFSCTNQDQIRNHPPRLRRNAL